MLIDPKQDRIRWRNPDITQTDLPMLRGDTALFGSFDFDALDLATGKRTEHVETEGMEVIAVGDRLVGVGPDEVLLQRL